MKHIIYQIIDDYDLGNETEFNSTLRNLSADELDLILNRMDSWYKSNRETLLSQTENDSLFNIWLPKTRAQSLIELSSRCVVSDKVVVDDSFYSYLAFYSAVKSDPDYLAKNFNLDRLEIDPKLLYIYMQEVICDNLSKLIDFYLRAKSLVDHGQLIPFVDVTTTWYEPLSESSQENIVTTFFAAIMNSDQEMAGFLDESVAILHELNKSSFKDDRLVLRLGALVKRFFETGLEAGNLAGALLYGLLLSRLPANGLDLLDEQSPKILNVLLSVFGEAASKFNNIHGLKPFSSNTLCVPALGSVPFGEVLEVKNKEKDSFERFKTAIQVRVGKISSEPGTDDWEREILSIRSELKKDVADIDAALKESEKKPLQTIICRSDKSYLFGGFSFVWPFRARQ